MAEVQANTNSSKALGRIVIIIVVLVLISGGYHVLAASFEIRIHG